MSSPTPGNLPNWTGLLGWSTTYHDGTTASQFGSMTDERKKWLENALNSAFGGQENPAQVMEKAVQEIKEGRISAGLDMFDYTSDFLDCAENFGKVGGLECVVSLLTNENPDIVRRAMEILGMYLPNNARLQLEAALKQNCLYQLNEVINTHRDNCSLITTAVSVIGGLIRNVTVLETNFVKNEGVESLLDLPYVASDSRLLLKVVSIISFLASRHDLRSKNAAFNELLIEVYCNDSLNKTDLQLWEVLASFLSSVSLNEETVRNIRKRMSWIIALDDSVAQDYEAELASLNQALSE